MKLLLTSNGLTNDSIMRALVDLVGKPADQIAVVFIPTAMNANEGDKGWFINNLHDIKKRGFKLIDIVDISALPKNVWLPRIESGDVIFFSGGSTSHLMRYLKESGLAEMLPELLKSRVYVGISAGSIVATPTLLLSREDKKVYYEKEFGYRSEEALNYVDVYIRPHLNSPYSQSMGQEYFDEIAKKAQKPIYLLDDQSALKIIDDEIEVVTEGEFIKL